VNGHSEQEKILEEIAFHHTSASGSNSADHGGSALPSFRALWRDSRFKFFPSKIKIQHSSLDNPFTAHPHHPTKNWARQAADPYLPFFCYDSSSYFRVHSRDSRFHFFLIQAGKEF